MTEVTAAIITTATMACCIVFICARAFRPTRGEAGTLRPLPDPKPPEAKL